MSARRRARAVAAILAIAVMPRAARTAPQQPPVFRAGVDSVQLNVAVFNGIRPVSGLGMGDFEVVDNGVPQTLVSVGRETEPIDLTFVIDTSASVTPTLAEAIVSAVNKVRAKLRPDDRLGLISFNQVIHERLALRPAADSKNVALGAAAGWTSLNDAIAVALTTKPEPDRRRMIMVFTDGDDTMSYLDEASVLDVAGRTQTTVFVVARGSAPVVPSEFFNKLAVVTGGLAQLVESYGLQQTGTDSFKFGENKELLDAPFLKAFEEFRTSYVLRYMPAGIPRPGWHDVTVRVTKPGNKYQVRTRSGYRG